MPSIAAWPTCRVAAPAAKWCTGHWSTISGTTSEGPNQNENASQKTRRTADERMRNIRVVVNRTLEMPESGQQHFVLRLAVVSYRHATAKAEHQMVDASDMIFYAESDCGCLTSGFCAADRSNCLELNK